MGPIVAMEPSEVVVRLQMDMESGIVDDRESAPSPRSLRRRLRLPVMPNDATLVFVFGMLLSLNSSEITSVGYALHASSTQAELAIDDYLRSVILTMHFSGLLLGDLF